MLSISLQTDAAAPPVLRGIRSQKLRLSSTVQGSFAPSNLREEVACLQIKLNHSDRLLGSKIASLSQALMEDHEELQQLEEEVKEGWGGSDLAQINPQWSESPGYSGMLYASFQHYRL